MDTYPGSTNPSLKTALAATMNTILLQALASFPLLLGSGARLRKAYCEHSEGLPTLLNAHYGPTSPMEDDVVAFISAAH